MALFGFGKKKDEVKEAPCCAPAEKTKAECCGGTEAEVVQEPSCACNGHVPEYEVSSGECACGGTGCSIKILGAGCKSCHDQFEFVQSAVKAMDLDAEVEYVTDMERVMAYGVMSMPAIVVNEKVVSMGKVLKPAEVENLLKKLGC